MLRRPASPPSATSTTTEPGPSSGHALRLLDDLPQPVFADEGTGAQPVGPGLRFERHSDRLQTVGLSSIGKVELSVTISARLSEGEAQRLLRSVAGYVVSANYRLEAGEIVRHEDHSYQLVEGRHGVLLLRTSDEETV